MRFESENAPTSFWELHYVQELIAERNAHFDGETANGQRETRNHRWVMTVRREIDGTN